MKSPSETVPQVVAQFIFIVLVVVVMFGVSLLFPPTSRRARERAARKGK